MTNSFDKKYNLFKATFFDIFKTIVQAENIADDNLFPPQVLEMILKVDNKINVQKLKNPVKYSMAVESITTDGFEVVIFDNVVITDAEIHIGNGINLLLRNVKWLASQQPA